MVLYSALEEGIINYPTQPNQYIPNMFVFSSFCLSFLARGILDASSVVLAVMINQIQVTSDDVISEIVTFS